MVSLRNCTIEELEGLCNYKDVYCFGSGSQADWLRRENLGFNMAVNIQAFIDNDSRKSGMVKVIDGISIPIISYKEFVERYTNNAIVITTSMYFADMISQMDKEEVLEGMPCYIDVFIDNYKLQKQIRFNHSSDIKIPKIIHYCWFGKNPIPKELQEYMKSWKKYCPDYEIICWDETNYDVSKNRYMRQAYEAKKWAFVSDYARIDVLYKYGGIYLDTDIELVKSLDDLLKCEFFCGFEQGGQVAFGLGIGAVKGHYILKDLLKIYEEVSFVKDDGSLNLTPCPYYQTECLKRYGLKTNGKYQEIKDIVVYPREVLAPENFYGINTCYSEHTHSIHHYNASWLINKNRGTSINNSILRRMEA